MKKQKEVSVLVGTVIIIAVTIVIFGGAIVYQNYAMQQTLSSITQSLSRACGLR